MYQTPEREETPSRGRRLFREPPRDSPTPGSSPYFQSETDTLLDEKRMVARKCELLKMRIRTNKMHQAETEDWLKQLRREEQKLQQELNGAEDELRELNRQLKEPDNTKRLTCNICGNAPATKTDKRCPPTFYCDSKKCQSNHK